MLFVIVSVVIVSVVIVLVGIVVLVIVVVSVERLPSPVSYGFSVSIVRAGL